MRLPSVILLLLLSVSATALAVPDKAIRPPTTGPHVPLEKPKVAPWTIKYFTRDCNRDDTGDAACAISFWIDTNTPGEPPVYCYFIVASANAIINKISCGNDWTVSSSWSRGSGGLGKGFTTLTLYNKPHGFVAWPRFYDWEIVNGIHATQDRNVEPDWY